MQLLLVLSGFFSMVIPAAILAPVLGATGVWLANPIGIVMTMLTVPIYNIIYWKRLLGNYEEVLVLKPDFGVPAEEKEQVIIDELEKMVEGMQEKLDYRRDVVEKRTKFRLTQKRILLNVIRR